ncbi:MAG TPA: hypothetical protein VK616_07770 [Flavitalea sp.]|nr:hypothetical protein [Flavitalea sp.]
MRHLSTFLSILAFGLVVEMGTSCKKETVSPASNSVASTTSKTYQQDTTTTSQPYNDRGCGNGNGNSHVGGQ